MRRGAEGPHGREADFLHGHTVKVRVRVETRVRIMVRVMVRVPCEGVQRVRMNENPIF